MNKPLPDWTAYACRFCHRLPYLLAENVRTVAEGGCVGGCGHPRNDTPEGMLNALTTLGERIGAMKIRATLEQSHLIQEDRAHADALTERLLAMIRRTEHTDTSGCWCEPTPHTEGDTTIWEHHDRSERS